MGQAVLWTLLIAMIVTMFIALLTKIVITIKHIRDDKKADINNIKVINEAKIPADEDIKTAEDEGFKPFNC